MADGLDGLDAELFKITELSADDEAVAAANTTSSALDADAAAAAVVGIFVVRRRIRLPDFSFSIRTQFRALSTRQQAEAESETKF